MTVDEDIILTPDLIYRILYTLGQTLAEFRDAIGVADQTVHDWEMGELRPSPDRLEAVLEQLQVRPMRRPPLPIDGV